MEDINITELMHWLWNKDKEKYTLIAFGHYEIIDEKNDRRI